jgi:CubicO group peptidase (beta-lactamase class C family)
MEMEVKLTGRAWSGLLGWWMVALVGCGSPGTSAEAALADKPQSTGQEASLSARILLGAKPAPTAPVHNRLLAPTEDSGPPLHGLEGRLSIPETRMNASVPAGDLGDAGQMWLPGFSVDFLTAGDHLVALDREIVRSTGPRSYWNIILSPGRIWSEPGDDGRSRASIPFVLVGDEYNEAHNGILTFVFDSLNASSAFFQVTQETALWNQVDLWGLLPLEYEPGEISRRNALQADYAEELDNETPVRSWSDLEDRFAVGTAAEFNLGMDPVGVSAAGLIVDDVIYLQPCHTRHGDFPYCSQMRHGVFSVTKSFGAALTMLRLAEKYGEGVFDLKIADFVSIEADHDGWAGVTFGDALNMTTGVGDHVPRRVHPNIMHGDEDEAKFFTFLRAPSRAGKLQACFTYADYEWGPGEVARYNSCNTFLLSSALDSLVRSREGAGADTWGMVVKEVLHPIGIRHAPIMRTIENDGSTGIPIFGYGLYLRPDDVAKLSRLFLNGGANEGRQLLHPGRLAEALFRTDEIGLPTGDRNSIGAFTYHMSFNGMPYRTQDGSVRRIPFGTGYGGNHVVLMPNGIAAFRFADSGAYGIGPMVEAARAIRPIP